MGENSKISWCDHTFNPWIGCTKVDPGCANCYAEADQDKRRGRAKWGPHGTRSMTKTWGDPVKWNKQAEKLGVRKKVFCLSLGDVFEDWNDFIIDHTGRPLGQCAAYSHRETMRAHCSKCGGRQDDLSMSDLRRDLFKLIDATPNLDWLLLTKRPENICKMWPDRLNHFSEENTGAQGARSSTFRHNVHLGTSVSDQETAARMVPELIECRALSPVLFVSAEPLLGPINFNEATQCLCGDHGLHCLGCDRHGIDQIICGGESGPNSRGCDIEWSRDIFRQCREAGVSFFMKQLGSNPFMGVKGFGPAIHDKKGGNPEEWPEDLRVREFPEVELTR